MQDDDDNDYPMILNIRAKNHTSERTIVPWTVIFMKIVMILMMMIMIILVMSLMIMTGVIANSYSCPT